MLCNRQNPVIADTNVSDRKKCLKTIEDIVDLKIHPPNILKMLTASQLKDQITCQALT